MYCFDCICIGEVLVRCWFNKWFNSTEIPWVKYICEFFFKKKEKIAESSTKCKMLHEMCSIMKKITWIPGGIHLLSFVCFFFVNYTSKQHTIYLVGASIWPSVFFLNANQKATWLFEMQYIFQGIYKINAKLNLKRSTELSINHKPCFGIFEVRNHTCSWSKVFYIGI